MKTIGLIGGMSWESSAEYYRLINEEIKKRSGGFNSAPTVMVSVNFAKIEELQRKNDWSAAGDILAKHASNLEKAGSQCVVLCTNTMHIVADKIENAINIPFLHIADATGEAIKTKNIKRVALLGTKFTMQKNFYKGRLSSKYNLEVIIPSVPEQNIVHKIIYDELCRGEVNTSSKTDYIRIIDNLIADGAEAIILGCTEIGLLIKETDIEIPVFDTTIIHAMKAVDFALYAT